MRLVRPRLGTSAVLLGGCTSGPYFIGAACRGTECGGSGGTSAGAAGTNSSDLTFAVDLDDSGASHLKAELVVAGNAVQAALRFRGESATVSDWRSDEVGLLVSGAATPSTQLEPPFTAGTRAVGLPSDAATYVAESAEEGDAGAGDFALELVLRVALGATIVDKRSGGVGWAARGSAAGSLVL